jgi:hypothetical protein
VLEPESGVFRCRNASTDGIAGRNPDGSIDYGYYRRRASRLRRVELRESSIRAVRYVAPLIAVAIAAAAIFAMPAHDAPMPPHGADFASAGWPMLTGCVAKHPPVHSCQ